MAQASRRAIGLCTAPLHNADQPSPLAPIPSKRVMS
mgnify:FL=1